MTTSDWIQVITSVITATTAIVSIFISIKSLKQAERSNYDANRPYVQLYVETLDTVYFDRYLVLKNFGNSGAKILAINFESELDEYNEPRQMSSLVNGTIAPGQKFSTSIERSYKGKIHAKIKYSDMQGKIFEDEYILKSDQEKDLLWSSRSPHKGNEIEKAIQNGVAAIVKVLK